MYKLVLCLLLIAFVGVSGCTQINESVKNVQNESLKIPSSGMTYPAYLAVPESEGKWPGIVMIHSFNGLEPGYKTLVDKFARDGFVVIAPEWQTFNKTPDDGAVSQLIKDSVTYLKTRKDVDVSNLGLTGFCAGGRYTMLFLPQMDFKSGVAFYGFPYSGGFRNESKPADFIAQLKVPMLMIHGANDQASKISDIYRYATDLNTSGKYFEFKVYQGEPHGFMIQNGQLSQSFPSKDAYWQMATFFNRTLKQL
jgi:carboxymethylenebutenolidase